MISRAVTCRGSLARRVLRLRVWSTSMATRDVADFRMEVLLRLSESFRSRNSRALKGSTTVCSSASGTLRVPRYLRPLDTGLGRHVSRSPPVCGSEFRLVLMVRVGTDVIGNAQEAGHGRLTMIRRSDEREQRRSRGLTCSAPTHRFGRDRKQAAQDVPGRAGPARLPRARPDRRLSPSWASISRRVCRARRASASTVASHAAAKVNAVLSLERRFACLLQRQHG